MGGEKTTWKLNRFFPFVLVLLVALSISSVIDLRVNSQAIGNTITSVDVWKEEAPMQIARSSLGVAVVNGKIYAIGGCTNTGYTAVNITNATEEYDPTTNRWTFKAPMPYPRYQFGTAIIGDEIYCIGGAGYSTNSSEIWTGTNQVYDTATDIWETKAPVPTIGGVSFVTEANVVNEKIYVVEALNNGTTLNYVYDPTNDVWAAKAPAPLTMTAGVSAVANGKIYFFAVNKTQIYDPPTNTWSIGAPEPALQLSNQTGQPSVDAWAAVATSGIFAPQRIYVLGSASVFGGGKNASTAFTTHRLTHGLLVQTCLQIELILKPQWLTTNYT